MRLSRLPDTPSVGRAGKEVAHMAVKTLRRQKGHIEVPCAFCKGKGTDPLRVMSSLSNCPVCGGRKRVSVKEPLQECAFCDGSGVHPHTRMTCTACLGKGVVTMPKPVRKCPQCGGTGANGHERMPCTSCKGIGVVPAGTGERRSRKPARRKSAQRSRSTV